MLGGPTCPDVSRTCAPGQLEKLANREEMPMVKAKVVQSVDRCPQRSLEP